MFGSFFRRHFEEPPLSWRLRPKVFDPFDPLNFGGKVLLPSLVLHDLIQYNVKAPYVFEVSHSEKIFKTSVGVLEFTLETNEIIMPKWVYDQLDLYDHEYIDLECVKKEKGTFTKLLPHSSDFLEVQNPKEMLENCLVNYQVLTVGDELVLDFRDYGILRFTVHELESEEGKANSVYIVDVDLSVDFLPPIGYERKLEKEKKERKKIFYFKGKEKVDSCKDFGLFFN